VNPSVAFPVAELPRTRPCVHSHCCVLPYTHAPPAAVRGPGKGYFTCANPSAVVPGIHSSQSGASGFTFSQVSATLPGHMFVPFSATSSGYGQVGTSPRNIYYFVIMHRNALACTYLSWGLLLDLTLFLAAHALGTCVLCLFCLQ